MTCLAISQGDGRQVRRGCRRDEASGGIKVPMLIMLGRTTRWGLGAFGIAGAQRLLEPMQQELVHAAAAAGRAKLTDVDASLVRTRFL